MKTGAFPAAGNPDFAAQGYQPFSDQVTVKQKTSVFQ